MSALCLVIKKEPEEPSQQPAEDAPTGLSESSPIQTEFVNIKMEMDLETTGVRIKEEPRPYSPTPDVNALVPQTQLSYYPPNHLEPRSESWRHLDAQKEDGSPQAPLFNSLQSWHKSLIMDGKNLSQSVPVEFEKPDENDGDNSADNKISKGKPTTKDTDLHWTCTPDGKYACKICSKTYSTTGNFQRHYLIHSQGPIKCQICSKSFTSANQLQRHSKVHGTYDCNECGKVFRTSSNLFQHKRVHMTEKPFKCPLCGKDFTVKSNLKKHMGKSRCKAYTGPITCDVCHKEFKTGFLLKSHLRRHTTEKPFNCDLCDMNFKYKSTLIRHIQVHNGLRPYTCEVCNKAFTHLSLLKPHMRIHTGEKPYACPVCSKLFTHKHNMERHALRHKREKKTVCEVCNKKFPKESRLKYHMRTHIAEKHFRCYVCPKKFSHRQNVLRHYTRKHPNATYEGTDTDAKIATKLWEEAMNKKKELENLKNGNDKVGKTLDVVVEVEIASESEEILPDVDRSSINDTVVPKKKKLSHIVAALSEKISWKCEENNKNGSSTIKIEVEPFDSDDEVLAKKIKNVDTKKVKLPNGVKNVNGNERNAGNETVAVCNETIANNVIKIKREVLSDEEILPDANRDVHNIPILVEIKKEIDL